MDILPQDHISEENHEYHRTRYIVWGLCVFVLVVLYMCFSAPFSSKPATIHISSRQTVAQVSLQLEGKEVIRFPRVFRGFVSLFATSTQIAVGDYYIERGTPVWKVAWMISRGIHNITPIKVTFPEGTTNFQMVEVLAKRIPNFDTLLFEKEIADKQGYLFPDTYFFYPLSTTDEILDTLSSNFTKRIKVLQKENPDSKYSRADIVRMAAILEREARPADANLIAGILWKRIKLGMPLQVDASPETYKTKGLPQEPIANPGSLMLKAAMSPKDSSYLYYLHDKNGMVHFANTYSDHKRNIAQYLK